MNMAELRERKSGTKFTPVYNYTIGAGETIDIYCRISEQQIATPFDKHFEHLFEKRKKEADDFYAAILPKGVKKDKAAIQRQA